VFASLLTFALASSAYDYQKALHPAAGANTLGLSGRPTSGGGDWIDRALPAGAEAAIVPTIVGDVGTTRKAWWDAEFWNKAVTRMYVTSPTWIDSDFAFDSLRMDFETGRLSVGHPLPYLVVPSADRRMGIAGRVIASNGLLQLIKPARPLRALWAGRGTDEDGWTPAGTPAAVRVFPTPAPALQRYDVTFTLVTPPGVSGRRRFEVVDGFRRVPRSIPAGVPAAVRTAICARAGEAHDVQIVVPGSTQLPGSPRRVGVAVVGIRVQPHGSCRRVTGSAPVGAAG
jgi:hypothetical protein